MSETILKVKNITKAYGNTTVLNNLSFSLKKGEIYGLIGKNGAGKSTLMKIIVGCIKPDHGSIEVISDKISKNKAYGCLIESPTFYAELNSYENIEIFSQINGDKLSNQDIFNLLKKVGLEDVGKKKVKNFSIGMKQRLGIAISLLNNPEILIWDEPINGLDPVGIKEIRDLILELNKEEVTFIISSHILNELDKIATRYGFLNNGRIAKEVTNTEVQNSNKSLEEIYFDLLKEKISD